MSKVSQLLARLEQVRKTGPDRWMACCPAHDDRTPSLSIRETNERVLIYCFAGCGAVDVVESVGLDFSALFPDKDLVIDFWDRPQRIPAADALRILDNEAWLVELCARRTAKERLTEKDRAELQVAAQRISEIRMQWMKQA